MMTEQTDERKSERLQNLPALTGEQADQVMEIVDRAQGDNYSRQPRFEDRTDSIFASVLRWVKMADIEAPVYAANSRTRDEWLQTFWPRESNLAGVINSVVAIDKNRGWSLTGGRNQVRRYVPVMHGYEDGKGWRYGIGLASGSFYTADISTIVETGRDGEGGPLRALYHVDPARCQLTEAGLKYYPPRGKVQPWTEGDDFFRVSGLSVTDEKFLGLAYCAVSRCLELAKTMIAIYQHDQEQLGARAPRGLLLLQGIGENQWKQAMEAREERLDGLQQKYYGAVAVLATEGIDQIDAKVVALSNLPADFNRLEFVNLLMYSYALCFGYDASEFWPVQFGSLGRGTEAEMQHRKATGKGGLDFILAYQEQLQAQLPPTLQFEFDQRDPGGDLLEADVAKAWVEVAAAGYEASPGDFGLPLLSREEARYILANAGVIPHEWTETEEDAEATDTEQARLLATPEIQRAISEHPDEEIVRYSYKYPAHTMRTIWTPGRRSWPAAKRRQDDSEVLYRDPDRDFTITEADVDRAIAQGSRRVGPEFAELLSAPTLPEEETEGEEGANQ